MGISNHSNDRNATMTATCSHPTWAAISWAILNGSSANDTLGVTHIVGEVRSDVAARGRALAQQAGSASVSVTLSFIRFSEGQYVF